MYKGIHHIQPSLVNYLSPSSTNFTILPTVPTEVRIPLECMLVEVKNKKESEWKWARGTGHREDTHRWLMLTTAYLKSNRTWDMMYQRLNSTQTCGWCLLTTISQDAYIAQGHTLQYSVQSPTWTCVHSWHLTSTARQAHDHQMTQPNPWPLCSPIPLTLWPITNDMHANDGSEQGSAWDHKKTWHMHTRDKRTSTEGGHAREDCCRG